MEVGEGEGPYPYSLTEQVLRRDIIGVIFCHQRKYSYTFAALQFDRQVINAIFKK